MKRLIIIGLSIIMLVAPVCSVSAQETASTVTAVVDKDYGAYKIKVINDNNAPVFRSKMSQTDVRTAVATEDEKSLVDNNGYTLTATISVTPIATTVSNSISMDITLDTTLADASGTVTKTNNLTETASPIQLSFAAPDNVINVNGQLTISDYKLTRTHDGLTDTIPVTYDSTTRTFAFKTDKFSTYSFFYEFANSIVPAISTDTTQDSAGTADDHKDDSNNGGSDVSPTPTPPTPPVNPVVTPVVDPPINPVVNPVVTPVIDPVQGADGKQITDNAGTSSTTPVQKEGKQKNPKKSNTNKDGDNKDKDKNRNINTEKTGKHNIIWIWLLLVILIIVLLILDYERSEEKRRGKK